MEFNGKEANVKPVSGDSKPEKVIAGILDEGDSESDSLLPARNGGISKGSPKTKRKVRWNDNNGKKLAEVVEFQPSDVSDSDDEDSDFCFCAIM